MSFAEEMRRRGLDSATRVVTAKIESAGEAVASILEIPQDAPVVYLERVRLGGGEPLILEQARLPAERFPGLLAFDLENRSLYDILAERYGTRIVRARETVEPVMLRRREAGLLELPTRSLALQIDGVAHAVDGNPVETARSFVRGDRTRYYLERDVIRAHWLEAPDHMRVAVAGVGRREPSLCPGERRGAAEDEFGACWGVIRVWRKAMRSTILRFGALFAILALVLAACSGGGGSSSEPDGSQAAESEAAESEGATGEVVEIRWFCCLGAGDDAETQVPTEEAVVAAFNESHDDIELVLEVVDYDSAYDALAVQIAGGNAPDILGPVGGTGAAAFEGEWLDLTELIESTGHDLTQYSEGSVEFYQVEGQGQVGLPFAIFPSMLFYQRSMFDEAGLEYPPQAYGEPYVLDGEEVEWNFDTLREVAKRLTVDINGNDATSADFDPENDRAVRIRPDLPGCPSHRLLLRVRQPGRR